MVSNAVKEVSEQDRRKLLAGFLYDMAKLMFSGVAVGVCRPCSQVRAWVTSILRV